jgi:Protein of unknown function (DUF1393).
MNEDADHICTRCGIASTTTLRSYGQIKRFLLSVVSAITYVLLTEGVFIMNKKTFTSQLVTMAFLIALEIILTRFLSINLQLIRIGFGFLPVAVAAIMFGPLWAGVGYAVGDILGMLIFPTGPYFPGFTLTAFITGVIFGFFFYNKKLTVPRTAAAAISVSLICTLGMNTYWLSILYGNAFAGLLPTRIAEACIMCAVEVPVILAVWKIVLTRVPAVRRQTAPVSLQHGLK